jgi:hypothetical protein
VTIIRTGAWLIARRILATAPRRVRNAIERAVLQEAQLLRGEIVRGLTEQNPGGDPIKPLAKNTITKRRMLGFRGTKALIVRSDLRRSVVVHQMAGTGAFVGVLRSARAKDGQSIANVAELNEFGSRPIVIKITPKMRRFLIAMIGRGERGRDTRGRFTSSTFTGSGSKGFIVVQIPARPFVRPAVEKLFSDRSVVRDRFFGRIARGLGGDFGH